MEVEEEEDEEKGGADECGTPSASDIVLRLIDQLPRYRAFDSWFTGDPSSPPRSPQCRRGRYYLFAIGKLGEKMRVASQSGQNKVLQENTSRIARSLDGILSTLSHSGLVSVLEGSILSTRGRPERTRKERQLQAVFQTVGRKRSGISRFLRRRIRDGILLEARAALSAVSKVLARKRKDEGRRPRNESSVRRAFAEGKRFFDGTV